MPIRDALPEQLKSLFRPWYYSVRRYWLYHKPKPVGVIHNYWQKPDAVNDPHTYLDGQPRSTFLVGLLQKYVPDNGSVLELGCNVGRNLNYLYEAGYRDLEAIEINPEAVQILKQTFPDMAAISKIHVGLIEDNIRSVGYKDCIFTMAVLVHIHPNSDWIFAEISKHAKTLIVIEGEQGASWRHFARNYRMIFENLGMRQMEEIDCTQIPELASDGLEHYVARVFQAARMDS
jgi:SAM-dependent methyltransferase